MWRPDAYCTENLYRQITVIRPTRRYGKVFKSHLFGTPTIVSTDAEVSKFILQSDAKTFVPSYPKSLSELMGKSSILLISGSLQRRIHSLVAAFFKSSILKSQITRDMEQFVEESMRVWRDGQLIHVQDEAKKVSLSFLSYFHFPSLVFSVPLDSSHLSSVRRYDLEFNEVGSVPLD